MKKQKIKLSKLKKILKDKLLRIKIKNEEADLIVNEFLENEIIGLETHGIKIFPRWYGYLKEKKLRKPKIKNKGGIFIIDAGGHPSQIFSKKIKEIIINNIKTMGILIIGIKNTLSFLKASTPLFNLVKKNLIGISMIFTNSKKCATEGFKIPVLGPHPIAFGIPVKNDLFIYDVSLAQISINKFNKLICDGVKKTDNFLGINKNGEKTKILKEINAILPFGEERGLGFLMAIEMIAGGLLEYKLGLDKPEYKADNGCLIITINPAFFGKTNEFIAKNKNFIDQLKNLNSKIHIPGEKYKKINKKIDYLFIKKNLLNEIINL